MNTRGAALEAGPMLIFLLKIIFAVVFLTLAIIEKEFEFLKENPGKVITEAVVAGLGAALAFLFIAWNRNSPSDQWIKIILFSFIIFFSIHFFLELSGFNESDERFKKPLGKIWIRLVLALTGILLVVFTVVGWDSPWAPPPLGWNPPPPWRLSPRGPAFALEAIVVGLGSAVPAYLISKNRGGSPREAMKAFALLCAGHFGMQYSGVYRKFGFMGSMPVNQSGMDWMYRFSGLKAT